MDGLEPIAVIGMACRFPGARDLDEFWLNLVAGRECVTFPGVDESRAAGVGPEELANPDYVRAYAAMPDSDRFDAGLFRMTPREAELCDPQLRVFLEVCHGAVEHAGYDPFGYRDSVAVYGCVGPNGYLPMHLARRPDLIGPSGMLVQTLNQPDYLATLVAYKLDLRGPAMTVLSACSSSLVAVHLACQALRLGECDAAIAGGSALRLPVGAGYLWTPGGVMSADGHCRPFDTAATGTIFGSGAGAVLLKRLDDAIADGDHVKAVVLGGAVNNDGADKLSFSAPSVSGQAAAVTEAMALAGTDPAEIGYVEAHATGTALGDPVEVAALAEAYAGLGGQPLEPGSCLLGSVKSNIGHMDGAAGIAGFIKTVLTLDREAIPGTVHLGTPNPRLELEKTGFRVSASLEPWPRTPGRPRRAAVTSLGIGGTNAHAVLGEGPAPVYRRGDAQPRVVIWSAGTEQGAVRLRSELAGYFAGRGAGCFADAVATLQHGRTHHRVRGAVVVRGLDELDRALAGDPVTGTAAPDLTVGYLFPGQGAQHARMAAGLYGTVRPFTITMDECLELFEAHGAPVYEPWLELAGDASTGDRPVHQELLFAVNYALAETWRNWGVPPAAVLGHSLGELCAATVAGVFALPDAVRLVAARAAAMAEHPVTGGMLAVAAGEAETAPLIGGSLAIAAVNGARQTVVSGPPAALDELAGRLRADGIASRRLAVPGAFHHPGWQPAATAWAGEFTGVRLSAPRLPLYSARTGKAVEPAQATDPAFWTAQLVEPVRFHDALGALLRECRPGLVLETGPRRTLTGLARVHPDLGPAQAVPSLPSGRDDHTELLGAAARAWVAGAPVDWAAAGQPRPAVRVPVPGYPYERTRHWVDPPAAVVAQPAPLAPAGTPAEPAPAVTELRWRAAPAPQPAPGRPPTGRRALVILPDGEAALSVLLAVQRAGLRPYRVAPERAADLDEVLESLDGPPPDLVLYGAVERDRSPAVDRLCVHVTRLLAVCQAALTSRRWPEPPRLVLVTSRAVDVSGAEQVEPDVASLTPLLATAALERPGTSWAAIDVDPGVDPALLAAQIAAPGAAGVVALRGRRRWLPREEPVSLSAGAGVLREEGVYLLTGGTGGLGMAVASGLAGTGLRPRLILLSRTGPAAVPDSALRDLRAAGAVVDVYACDVTDVRALDRVLGEVTARYGPVNGLLHLAGVPGGRMLAFRDLPGALAVMAPKTTGTASLDAAFERQPRLDFAVYFGSRAAVEGLVGGADYAVANAFLDAAARTSPLAGGRVLSIGWPVWREVGMAARSDVDISQLSAAVRERASGARPAPPEPALVWEHELSQATHWSLDEHRVGPLPLLPGTAYIDLLVRGFREAVPGLDGRPLVIEDLVFQAPLFAAQPRVLRLTARPSGNGYDVLVQSRPADADSGWTTHATGSLAAGDQPPPEVDLAALRQRFAAAGERQVIARRGGGVGMFTQGPRWHNIEAYWDAGDERLMSVHLPAPYLSDLTGHALHPALMDTAMAAIRTGAHHSSVPFLYRRCAVFADLPARFFVHARRDAPARADTVSGDIDLIAEDGRLLLRAEGFTMRVVDRDSLVAATAPAGTAAEPAADASPDGLAPEAGVDLLLRLLDAGLTGHVLVRPHRHDQPLPVGESDLAARTGAPDAAAHQPDPISPAAAPDPGPVAVAGPPAPTARPADGPQPAGAELAAAAEPARSGAVEDRLAVLWQQALGTVTLAEDEDFFDAGGNSLTAVELMARIREVFQVKMSIALLLEARTFRQMVAALRDQGVR